MKKLTFAGTVAAAVTAGFIGLAAPALAAPTETSEAQDTVNSLEAEGYTVVINNPNGVALSDASVAGVRQGPESVQHTENRFDQAVETVQQSIVFVDVQ